METKTRDYLMDNYKALLIVLVVVGHFIDVASKDNNFLEILKWLIFSFHMPAFIFISGYFSKKSYPITSLIQKLLVPYLIFEVLYYLVYTFVVHKDTELYLLHPKFSMWYLMALFVWKVITPWVKKIPGHVLLAVLGGLAVGTTGIDDNFLTLPRMIVFYPFFLIGSEFDRSWLRRYRKRSLQIGSAAGLVVLNILVACVAWYSDLTPKIFYGRYNYDYLGLDLTEGIIIRLGCYVLALLMTMLMAIILPEKENRLSYLGSRTMAVYLFHGLIFTCFKTQKNFYNSLGNGMETFLAIGCSLLVVWVLSRKPFTDFTNWISNLHLPKKNISK